MFNRTTSRRKYSAVFQCRHGEYSCKIDEVSTAERVSFNPATNEFDGLCRNHIDTTIDYKVYF